MKSLRYWRGPALPWKPEWYPAAMQTVHAGKHRARVGHGGVHQMHAWGVSGSNHEAAVTTW
jgi:hypothetical protein